MDGMGVYHNVGRDSGEALCKKSLPKNSSHRRRYSNAFGTWTKGDGLCSQQSWGQNLRFSRKINLWQWLWWVKKHPDPSSPIFVGCLVVRWDSQQRMMNQKWRYITLMKKLCVLSVTVLTWSCRPSHPSQSYDLALREDTIRRYDDFYGLFVKP